MMRHTGASIVDAFIMASLNPAKVLKVDHFTGSLEVGKLADLIVVSESIEVQNVLLRGKIVE